MRAETPLLNAIDLIQNGQHQIEPDRESVGERAQAHAAKNSLTDRRVEEAVQYLSHLNIPFLGQRELSPTRRRTVRIVRWPYSLDYTRISMICRRITGKTR